MTEPTCSSCNTPLTKHLGLIGTCEKLQRAKIDLLKANSKITILRVELAHLKAKNSKLTFKKHEGDNN